MRHGVGGGARASSLNGERRALAALAIVGLSLSGGSAACVPMPAYNVVRSDVGTEMPKPAGCRLELMPRPPKRRHEQLGFIEVKTSPVHTEDQFRALVGDSVCQIGGDVIVAEKKHGEFLGGTILRYLPE
ncbi:MAG: hypothetical protein IPF92_09650 [Myxococcales bacterium]|nr:hypothetical protein [Myxococcales bacterium]MBL0192995.1 hypothetical protein [Myxococcales bacterium]HQY63992.1 hypothetical protein [Polyangiaceae bacterium]